MSTEFDDFCESDDDGELIVDATKKELPTIFRVCVSEKMSKDEFMHQLRAVNATRMALLDRFKATPRPLSDADRDELLVVMTTVSNDARSCEKLATDLALEHGVAMSVEVGASVELARLEVEFGVVPKGDRDGIVQGFASVVQRLSGAARVFNRYGDKVSLERSLQLLSIAYRRTACHDDEIRTLDALVELERSDKRVVALCEAYGRAIEQIFRVGNFETDDPADLQSDHVKSQNDDLMKLNYQFWLEYVWLKDQESFDYEAWVRQYKLPIFKMLIYVSTMLGHALTAGFDAKNVDDAEQASLEACRVAELLGDGELQCLALARRVEYRWTKLTDAEKRAALEELRAAAARWQPKATDLADTLKTLEDQYKRQSTCANCGASDAVQTCGQCRVVRYCNRDCQKEAWPVHKPLCQRFIEAASKSAHDGDDATARTDALKSLAALQTRMAAPAAPALQEEYDSDEDRDDKE